MSNSLYQTFGYELATQRQARLEAQARQYGLARGLKRARRVDHAQKSAASAPARAPHGSCAADLG
jgi:hypothetical protein